MSVESRARVVAAARSWRKTPFHLNAAVKGPNGGVDCLRLVWRSYIEAGLIEDGPDPWPHINLQHSQNSREDILAEFVGRHCGEVAPPPERVPLGGDIILVRRAQDLVSAHAVLVTEWPKAIHVLDTRRGVRESPNIDGLIRNYCCPERGLNGSIRVFDFWAQR